MVTKPRSGRAVRSRLDGYMLREGVTTWAGVTTVLLAIMLATRFTRFLSEAATGHLPREFLLKVVMLSSLQYLTILIPISLLLAVMLSLGRLYRDQEIAAMTGCGVGPWTLYRPFLTLTVSLAVLTAALAFEISPWAGREADRLFKDAQRQIQFTPFEEGRFKDVAGGRAVFYAASVARDTGDLGTIFARVEDAKGPAIVTAQRGAQSLDPKTGERVLTLDKGYRYAGEAGRADFDALKFESFTTRISPPSAPYLAGKRKIRETGQLLGSADPEDVAELQWRIAAPLTVLLLGIAAVPLSHTTPRSGRYGKLVLGILAYLFYSNLLAIGQAWIAKGYVGSTLGLWWVHAIAAGLALWLVSHRLGWRRA